ncbi:MAG: choice-of-anchor L domain-containing protein, partial [Lewinella sp.]|nr:choice-of-anchor L domain-containing protein [Lewinella sp.]
MKQGLTFFFLMLGFLAMAQPINDDCDGVIDLGVAPFCPENVFFSNVDATASDIGFGNIPNCFNGGTVQNDVWFAFTTSDTIFDYTITLTGMADGMDASIVNPQIALYRGDCMVDGLAELLCVSAAPGETSVELDAEGLTPNVTYFIRINDYSATGTPNWGTFLLCVDEQDPVSTIDEDGSTACSGTLYDSGGPDGDYGNNENNVFVICPNQPNQCINFTLEYYNVEFSEFTVTDQLNFYDGDAPNPADLIANIGGTDFATEITDGGGVCLMLQASSGCMTVEFISDGTSTFEGFAGSWECSSQACDVPDPITVDANVTEEDIVDALSTPQTTFTITNITCDEGSYGTFQAGDNTDLGLERGLLLTTGDLNWAVGPNLDEGGGNGNANRGQPGDPDLDVLSNLFGNGTTSNDACILELDVVAATDELTFEYIFGSDEYTEFVGTNFNDIFAFLISGPGIVGEAAIGNQLNIATLPNPENTFVQINSVNNEMNWQYFRSNELGQSLGYDGLTSDYLGVKKSLTARAEVIPCSTYHLKLAIADRGDFSWDSGVFISELRGGAPNITISFNSGIDYLIEDCTDEPDDLVISLNSPLEDTTTYNVVVEGSATLGVDYLLDLPDQVTFLPGQTNFSFPITVLSDMDNNEGIETIRISLTNDFGCGSVTYTTLDVELHDVLNVEINAGQDTTRLCVGGSVGLTAEGAAQYFWTPVNIFDNPSAGAPVVTPTESGWVSVVGNVLDCTDTDSIYLEILDPFVQIQAEEPVEICRGDTVMLRALNNVGSEGLVWSPAAFVTEPNQPITMVFPDNPTDFIATVNIAGCSVADTISVDVDFLNIPALANDTTICQNYSVQLADLINPDTSTVTYSWTPSGS